MAHAETFTVDTEQVLSALLANSDTNGDKKITKDDHPKVFSFKDKAGRIHEFSGHYHQANLLQELSLAKQNKQAFAELQTERITEEPRARISRQIRELFWDGLTRRVDNAHLAGLMDDSKVLPRPGSYIYVPSDDAQAREYFSQSPYHVGIVPKPLTPEFLKSLDGKHGPLALALEKNKSGNWEGKPFVVPGGRFDEMYGWDSYFESLGLIVDGRRDLAEAMVDNFVYQIEHYGKILNANRTYYLTRSQPPFLTSMIRAVYAQMPRNAESRAWLKKSLRAAILEYRNVWMAPERLTAIGLNHYAGWSIGVPPEVEPGHFDPIFAPYAEKRGMKLADFIAAYKSGSAKEPQLDEFFVHDQAVRESGHDTTYRWRTEAKDQCANFVTVDLNSLLYKTELDIAALIQQEFSDRFEMAAAVEGNKSKTRKLSVLHGREFAAAAAKRKERMREYLWDPKQEIFFDYDYKRGKRHSYVSAAAFYPLWAIDPSHPETRILSQAEAEHTVKNLLRELEEAGGIAASSAASLREFGDAKHERQWDFPNGWAPHQMIAWQALQNYGLQADARRLAEKWVAMITENATDYNGTIPEKFDVVKRSHRVFAEYGNVGTEFSYITREGFGWMNASYQVGRKLLSESAPK